MSLKTSAHWEPRNVKSNSGASLVHSGQCFSSFSSVAHDVEAQSKALSLSLGEACMRKGI